MTVPAARLAEATLCVPRYMGRPSTQNVADLDAVIAAGLLAKAAKSFPRRRLATACSSPRSGIAKAIVSPCRALAESGREVLQTERRRLNGQERRPARNAARPALPVIRGRRCSAVRGRGSGRYAAPASSAEAGVRARAAGAQPLLPGLVRGRGGGTDGDRRPVRRGRRPAHTGRLPATMARPRAVRERRSPESRRRCGPG